MRFNLLMTHKSAVTKELASYVFDSFNDLSINRITSQVNRWYHETFYLRELDYW